MILRLLLRIPEPRLYLQEILKQAIYLGAWINELYPTRQLTGAGSWLNPALL